MRVSSSVAESNVGRKRRHNEDSFVHAPPIFAVADGMGGAQAGEVASSLAAAAVLEGDVDPAMSGEQRVVELIRAANRRVHQRAIDDSTASGMGTTMTVAIFHGDGSVVIGHVGDSRAYRLRDGELEQLTDDHSLVAELVRRGELTPEEAQIHPQRSVITRALGTDVDVTVDAFTVEAEDEDVFLLCSDGLTTMVDAGTVADIVQEHRFDLGAAARALIQEANDRGGDDNITTVLFAVGEGDPETAPVPVPVVVPSGPDPDEEDTLHPEDNVRLPEEPRDDVTMVVSAAAIHEALASSPPAEPAAAPEASDSQPPPSTGETASTEEPTAALEPVPADETEPGDGEPKASAARIAVALLVIAILIALILLLVFKELPR